MALEAGAVIANKYQVTAELGRGGMGSVLSAKRLDDGKVVAVKVLHPQSMAFDDARERLRREAIAVSKIHSEHVTEVLDVIDDPELGVVLVFELLKGEPLADVLKRRLRLPLAEVAPIVEQILSGVADAHSVRVVHRDLKASNVFLEQKDGRVHVKILDFGISKLPRELGFEVLTKAGQNLGTFPYIPPEQIDNPSSVDHRADLYACGALIFRMITGQFPHYAKGVSELLSLKRSTPARRLRDVLPDGGPGIPARLEEFVAKLLATKPDDRYQSAWEAVEAWQSIASLMGFDTQMRPPEPTQRELEPPSEPQTPATQVGSPQAKRRNGPIDASAAAAGGVATAGKNLLSRASQPPGNPQGRTPPRQTRPPQRASATGAPKPEQRGPPPVAKRVDPGPSKAPGLGARNVSQPASINRPSRPIQGDSKGVRDAKGTSLQPGAPKSKSPSTGGPVLPSVSPPAVSSRYSLVVGRSNSDACSEPPPIADSEEPDPTTVFARKDREMLAPSQASNRPPSVKAVPSRPSKPPTIPSSAPARGASPRVSSPSQSPASPSRKPPAVQHNAVRPSPLGGPSKAASSASPVRSPGGLSREPAAVPPTKGAQPQAFKGSGPSPSKTPGGPFSKGAVSTPARGKEAVPKGRQDVAKVWDDDEEDDLQTLAFQSPMRTTYDPNRPPAGSFSDSFIPRIPQDSDDNESEPPTETFAKDSLPINQYAGKTHVVGSNAVVSRGGGGQRLGQTSNEPSDGFNASSPGVADIPKAPLVPKFGAPLHGARSAATLPSRSIPAVPANFTRSSSRPAPVPTAAPQLSPRDQGLSAPRAFDDAPGSMSSSRLASSYAGTELAAELKADAERLASSRAQALQGFPLPGPATGRSALAATHAGIRNGVGFGNAGIELVAESGTHASESDEASEWLKLFALVTVISAATVSAVLGWMISQRF